MDPTLAVIGGYPIYTFAVAFDAAVALGLLWFILRVRQAALPITRALDSASLALIAGLVGARAAYVVLHWRDYSHNLITATYLWEGGLSLIGGWTAGIVAAVLAIRSVGLPLRRTLDLAAPCLMLAQAVGLSGCIAAGCATGRQVPAGSALPHVLLADAAGVVVPRFPSQIVEAAGALVIVAGLLRVERRSPPDGIVFGLLIAGYGALRFVGEPLRGDSTPIGPLPAGTWWSALAVLFGLAWLDVARRTRRSLARGGSGA